MSFPWNDSSIARLAELAQTASTAEAARVLTAEYGHHINREAVGGKARRLGLRFKPEESSWTDERVDFLKKGLAAGDSFAVIALEMGLSRNAVIGKANRLGLREPKPSAIPNRAPKPKPERAPSYKRSRLALPVVPGGFASGPVDAPDLDAPKRWNCEPLPRSEPRSIIDIKLTGECKWPLGDAAVPGGMLFCAAPTSNRPWGKSLCPYCQEHAERALGPGTRSERRATEKPSDRAAA